MAERLRRFAAEELNIHLSVGSGVSVAGSKTYSQLFAESRELWIWGASPLDLERSGYWEKLCVDFLDKEGRLLVYFVPTLEVADRLALRFETELRTREYDADGMPQKNAEGFGATVFIVVTNLAISMPYIILTNPGSASMVREGVPPSGWAMGKQAQDFFEVPSRFVDHLIQTARAAGLGVARIADNFFPMGEKLKESGIPFSNYPSVDLLVGIKLDHSMGLFDGEPTGDKMAESHPLKFFPVFIRAYRKKAYELSKRRSDASEKRSFFKF